MSDYQSDHKGERASLLNRTMKLFGVIMVLVYIAVGIALITNPGGIFNMPAQFSIPAGGLLIVYGCFRGFRLYQDYFKSNS